jgi:hypothetical protein
MQTHSVTDSISLHILQPMGIEISMPSIIKKVRNYIPNFFFSEIDVMYIGDFDFLTENFETYKCMENAVYVTNTPMTEDDLFLDLIHAICDSVQQKNSYLIYQNVEISEEIDLEYDFTDALVDYLLSKDKNAFAIEKPNLHKLIQEIIKNESHSIQ